MIITLSSVSSGSPRLPILAQRPRSPSGARPPWSPSNTLHARYPNISGRPWASSSSNLPRLPHWSGQPVRPRQALSPIVAIRPCRPRSADYSSYSVLARWPLWPGIARIALWALVSWQARLSVWPGRAGGPGHALSSVVTCWASIAGGSWATLRT